MSKSLFVVSQTVDWLEWGRKDRERFKKHIGEVGEAQPRVCWGALPLRLVAKTRLLHLIPSAFHNIFAMKNYRSSRLRIANLSVGDRKHHGGSSRCRGTRGQHRTVRGLRYEATIDWQSTLPFSRGRLARECRPGEDYSEYQIRHPRYCKQHHQHPWAWTSEACRDLCNAGRGTASIAFTPQNRQHEESAIRSDQEIVQEPPFQANCQRD